MTKIIFWLIFIACLSASPSISQEPRKFTRTYESKAFTEGAFFLFKAVDVNHNGVKELIVTNFGRFGDHQGIGIEKKKQLKRDSTYVPSIFVAEWDKNELQIKFSKQWNTSTLTAAESQKYFLAFEAKQIVSWQIGDRVSVETVPPYLGLEWTKGKYVLREQQGPFNSGPLVGSWVFPWLSPSCNQSFPNKETWPRECIIGIRDLSKTGVPRIVTIYEEKIIGNKKHKQLLRVRRYEPGFPVEWEKLMDSSMYYFGSSSVDRFNRSAKGMLLLHALIFSPEGESSSRFLFERDQNRQGYLLKPIKGEFAIGDIAYDLPYTYLNVYDLPDVYIRKTQNPEVEEIWGYRFGQGTDKGKILLLRKVTLKPDLSGYISEDINFQHHESFIGVGFFDVQDLDGDGLDELILVEQTGKRKYSEENIFLSGIQDYIHILKWDGSKYQTMWVSPPFTKRGTKFLVEDIKNVGKKQLVVLSPYGTIQIWEMR